MLTANDATRQANDADEKHESGIARRIYIIISQALPDEAQANALSQA
jgi:hypothetical protein